MRRTILFAGVLLAAGAAHADDSPSAPPPLAPATRAPDALKTIVVERPAPLPLRGQLTLIPSAAAQTEAADPPARVAAANLAARVQPTRSGYLNAIQVFPFSEGALYQVYAAPGEVTDIALEPGELLAGSGPVALGDTTRWIVGTTESGAGAGKHVHVLLKPTAASLATNLVINTDRRTYHLELRATPAAYMASVSWRYPEGELVAVRQAAAAEKAAEPTVSGIDVSRLRFRYRIEGDKASWRPVQAFDDGVRVYIAMPATLPQGEAPPLFVLGADGKGELVNYRVRDCWYVVDRLFAAAELRLGDKRQQVVRIVRTDARASR